jgi:hypothetical protein
MSLTPKQTVWRLIKADYGSDEPVGIVEIDEDRQLHHWITLPDGQIRQWYNYRTMDQIELDTILSFEIVPVLKVEYRPIAKYFNDSCESINELLIIVGLMILVESVLVLIAEFAYKLGGAIVDNYDVLYILTGLLLSSFVVLGILSYCCNIGRVRYNNITKDDREPYNWNRGNRTRDTWT